MSIKDLLDSPLTAPNSEPNTSLSPSSFDRIIQARSSSEKRIDDSIASSQVLDAEYRLQYKRQQELGPLASLGTDSDIVRTVLGGLVSFAGTSSGGIGRLFGEVSTGANSDNISQKGLEATDKASKKLTSVGDYLSSLGQEIKDSRDVSTLYNEKQSQITGNVFDISTWDFGENPSLEGYTTQFIGVMSEFAPQLLGLLAKSPKLILATMAAIGGNQAGESQAKEAEDFIKSKSHEELLSESPAYRELINTNGDSPESRESAKSEVANTAAMVSYGTGAAIGGLSGALTGFLLKPAQSAISKVATGVTTRTPASAALSAVEEGSLEVAETVGSRAVVNQVIGTERELGEDTLADAVFGAAAGGSLGGVAGAGSAINDKVEARDKRLKGKLTRDEFIDQKIIELADNGDFESLVAPENRKTLPRERVALTLQTIAQSENESEETKAKAEAALDKLESSILTELNDFDEESNTQADIEAGEAAIKEAETKIAETESKLEDPELSEDDRVKLIADLERYKTVSDFVAEQNALIKNSNTGAKKLKQEYENIRKIRTPVSTGSNTGADSSVEPVQASEVQTSRDTLNNPESSANDVRNASDVILRTAVVDPDKVTNDDVDALASAPNTSLGKIGQRIAKGIKTTKERLEELSGIEGVRLEIFAGDGTTNNVSIKMYQETIGKAISSGNVDSAKQLVKQLSNFRTHHSNKSKASKEAYKALENSNFRVGQAIIPDPNIKNGWIVKPLSKDFTSKDVQNLGGLFFTGRSSDKLINAIGLEVEALNAATSTYKLAINAIEALNQRPENQPGFDAAVIPDQTVTSKTVDQETTSQTETEQNTEAQQPAGGEAPNAGVQASVNLDTPVGRLKELVDSGATINDIINWTSNTNSRLHKVLLRKLVRIGNFRDIKITDKTVTVKNENGSYKATGTYFPKDHSIGLYLDESIDADPESIVEVVIHELIHAATHSQIKGDKKVQQEVKRITSEINEWLKVEGNSEKISDLSKLKHALSNPQELLATVISSPELLSDLSQIPSGSETVLSKLLNSVLDFIKKVANLNTPEANLAKDILSLGENILETQSTKGEVVYGFQEEITETIEGEISPEEYISVNLVNAFLTIKKDTPLAKADNFLTKFLSNAKRDTSFILRALKNDKEYLDAVLNNTEDFNGYLEHIESMSQSIFKSIDSIFKDSPKGFRHTNYMTYLTNNEGKLDQSVKDAIAYSIISYLNSYGDSLYMNTPDQIRSILKLNKTDVLDPAKAAELIDKGTTKDFVVNSLGSHIYKTMGFKLNGDNSYRAIEQNLQGALGAFALGVMLDLGHLERQTVQLNKLFDNVKDPKLTMTMVRFKASGQDKGQPVPNQTIQKLISISKGASTFLDKVFEVESLVKRPSLEPVKKVASPTNSTLRTPKAQRDLLRKGQETPFTFNQLFMGENGILRRISRDAFESFAGAREPNFKVQHKYNLDKYRAQIVGIRRAIDGLNTFVSEDLDGDTTKPFYFKYQPWKMGRFGIASNLINYQENKIHRYLLNVDGSTYEVDPSKDDINSRAFKYAVLEAFGKKIDSGKPETVIRQFAQLVVDPTYTEALSILQDMLNNDQPLTSEQEVIIRDAIQEAGEDFHSFAGLVALAQYNNSVTSGISFETNLVIEGDGKTNGPIFTMLQLGLSASDRYNKQLMAMGGVFTEDSSMESYGDYAEKTQLDLYKFIASRAKTILNENPDNRVQPFMNLVNLVLGNIFDTPVGDTDPNKIDPLNKSGVTAKGRKLVKNPITQVVFGSNPGNTINNLSHEFIEEFYTQLEVNLFNQDVLDSLVIGVNQVLPSNLHLPRLNSKTAVSFTFTEAQQSSIKEQFKSTIGNAIEVSVREKFGNLLENRKVINEVSNLSANIYIAIRNAYERNALDSKYADKKFPNSFNLGLSIREERELTNSLEEIFPSVHSPLSKKGDTHMAGIPLIKENYKAPLKADGTGNSERVKFNKSVDGVKSIPYVIKELTLVEPGVAGLILAIHSMDSSIASMATALFPGMNHHDALTIASNLAPEAIQAMNREFLDANVNYNVTEEMVITLARILDGIQDVIQPVSTDLQLRKDLGNLGDNLSETINKLLTAASNIHGSKKEFLGQVSKVAQYYVPNGGIELSVEDIKANKQKVSQLPSLVEALEQRGYDSSKLSFAIDDAISLIEDNADKALIEELENSLNSSNEIETVQDNNQEPLASPPPKVSGQAAREFNTTEIFEALNKDKPINDTHKARLVSYLDNLVNKLYGPMGALRHDVVGKLGESIVDLQVHAFQQGNHLFSSAVNGFVNLSKAEAFVLEQIELTVREILDPTALADKELIKIYNEARKRIKPQDLFQGDWSKASPQQVEQTENLYKFIFNLNNDLNDTGSNHLSRFVALGLVYEPLSKLLDFSVITSVEPGSNKLGDRLLAFYNKATQKLSNQVNDIYSGQKANARIQRLIERLVQNEHRRKLSLIKSEKDLISDLDDIAEYGSEAIRKTVTKVAKSDFFYDSKYNWLKATGSLTATVSESRVTELMGVLEAFRNSRYQNERLGIFASLANELRGGTDENEQFLKLLSQSNTIQQERKRRFDATKAEVLAAFEGSQDFTEQDKESLTSLLLKTDLSSLLDSMSVNEIVDLINDPSKLQLEIDKRIDTVRKSNFSDAYLFDSHDLAYYMATGVVTSANLYLNSHNIAHQFGNSKRPNERDALSYVQPLTELTSLLALKMSDKTTVETVQRIINKDIARGSESGTEYLLRLHKHLVEDARKELFDNNPVLMMQGYIRDIYNPNNTVKVANLQEGQLLEEQGYIRQGTVKTDVHDTTVPSGELRHIYVLKNVGLRDYITASLSNTGLNSAGSSIHSGVNVNDPVNLTLWKKSNIKSIKTRKERVTNSRGKFPSNYDPSTNRKGHLVPTYGANGEVSTYRYLMNNNTKKLVMDHNLRFDDVLASMVSNQYDKIATAKQNEEVVKSLKDFYDRNPNKDGFIEVSATSSDEEGRNAYRLLPESTKKAINDVWGANRVYIRNDLIDMVTGYRKLSLTDSFNIDENVRTVTQKTLVTFMEMVFGKKAATIIERSENIWQDMVKIVKDVWVVRNLTTLLGNIASNTMLLLWYGVPPQDIVNSHREAFTGLINYQKDSSELAQLELSEKVKPTSKGQERIRELQFNLERNPVRELVDAGMFQSILEDIDAEKDDFKYKRELESIVSEQVARLPEPIQNIGKILTVSQETTLYKILFKGTQMSDFIGRYTLHKHLTTRKRKPLSRDKALSTVREAFINYDIPTHRGLQYGNDMGLVFFTKYYLRVQKILFGLYKDSPIRGLGLAALNNYTMNLSTINDSNILTSIGGNPVDTGALNIIDLHNEPVLMKLLLSFFE